MKVEKATVQVKGTLPVSLKLSDGRDVPVRPGQPRTLPAALVREAVEKMKAAKDSDCELLLVKYHERFVFPKVEKAKAAPPAPSTPPAPAPEPETPRRDSDSGGGGKSKKKNKR